MSVPTEVYDQKVTAALSTPSPLRSTSDTAVAEALAVYSGITLSTPEARRPVRALVATLRTQYRRGTLPLYGSPELEVHLSKVCSSLSPSGFDRWTASAGMSSAHFLGHLPLNQPGTLSYEDLGKDFEAGDVDPEACAWFWVTRVLLSLAYNFVAILQDVDTTCTCSSHEDDDL